MIALDSNQVTAVVDQLASTLSKIRPDPLMFYTYLERVLKEDAGAGEITYPCDIKIPKVNKYLLKGDFEPAYTIHLDAPIMNESGSYPIWNRQSAKAVKLRFGYKNCDPRFLCEHELSAECIHGFLGGASGHGKSVTMNSMLGGLFYEYAPWELEIHLSDAKIVEFKKYGVKHRIPHIASIAATEDADFVISVLQRAKTQMLERNKIFGILQVDNLKQFRAKTGLAMPQVLIVMDEFESTMKLAGRQAPIIAGLVDDYARLGRNTGYHIIMSTQNLTSDIPKSALGQIRLRMALGCTETVSEAILANKGAADNYGRIGMLIVNTSVLNGGKTDLYNETYQTPLLDGDDFQNEMEFLERKGAEVGFKASMSFYDENDMKLYTEFDSMVDKAFQRMDGSDELSGQATILCMGLPAFVTEDADEMFKLYLEHEDVETVLVCSSVTKRIYAHLHNVARDLHRQGYYILGYCTSEDVKEFVYTDLSYLCRSADKEPLSDIGNLVLKRNFLLEVEQSVNNVSYNQAGIDAIFDELGIPMESSRHDLMYRRYVVYSNLVTAKQWERIQPILPTFKDVFDEYQKCNAIIETLTPQKFSKVAYLVGDLSKIIGYGRDGKTQLQEQLKRTLQDASLVNVVFILYSQTMDGLNSMVKGAFRYAIFDNPDVRDYGRLGADEPKALNGKLAILFDNQDRDTPQRKYKRTLLEEEL